MRKVLLYITLSFIYFFIITPVAFFLILTGKRLLYTEFKSNESSYWLSTKNESSDKKRYLTLY